MTRGTRWILVFFCAASLGACTPYQQAHVPPLEKPVIKEEYFFPGDNAALPLRTWIPERVDAVIVALHGFNDYSHAFEHAGDYFHGRRIAVYAYDQRGFGRAMETGTWGNQRNYTSDLKQIVLALRAHHPGKPLFLLGESMGGAVTITALADPAFPPVDGAVLVAPAIWGGEAMNPAYRGSLWLFAHMLPAHRLTGQQLKIMASNNIEMLRALARDPLVIKATRIDAIYGIVRLMDTAYQRIGDVRAPLLLLYGGRDQVIPPEPVHLAVRRVRAPLTAGFYPNGYHMLMRDLEGDVTLADIASWVKKPGAPLPSGADEAWRQQFSETP